MENVVEQVETNENFFKKLCTKFKLPWKCTAFILYFIFIIVLFGGVSIIATIYEEFCKESFNFSTLSRSIATTASAIVAASLVELNLSYNIKFMPSLTIITISIVGVSFALFLWVFNISSGWSLLPAILSYAICLFVWIIANSENEKLCDETYYKRMLKDSRELSKNWD